MYIRVLATGCHTQSSAFLASSDLLLRVARSLDSQMQVSGPIALRHCLLAVLPYSIVMVVMVVIVVMVV